eukprot:scaffold823_cov219-Amphora_coffeaeformis.AAC.34
MSDLVWIFMNSAGQNVPADWKAVQVFVSSEFETIPRSIQLLTVNCKSKISTTLHEGDVKNAGRAHKFGSSTAKKTPSAKVYACLEPLMVKRTSNLLLSLIKELSSSSAQNLLQSITIIQTRSLLPSLGPHSSDGYLFLREAQKAQMNPALPIAAVSSYLCK